MLRREFLAGALFAQARPKPNLVFILADDLGYGDLGCYGQKIILTPHIDRLAAEGMRFTDCYAGCTVCAPSRSVLMTGKHTGHTSVRSNTGGVPLLPEDVTVAEVLRQAGYRTALFGKWGLGDEGSDGVPWKQGFDEFFGFLNQVHPHYQYPRALFDKDKLEPIGDAYANDVIAERALRFVTQDAQPFFLYLSFTVPHLELLAPDGDVEPYKSVIKEDGVYRELRRHYADNDFPRATYAAMVTRLDRYVGRLVEHIRSIGAEENTVIFFTSDNGTATPIWGDKGYFQSAGPLRGWKTNFYEGGIRTPMIVRWKGRIRPGTVSAHPWYFPDVLPTLAELAGAVPPAGIDGISVVPSLLGRGKQKRHEAMYWELPNYRRETGTFSEAPPPAAIRWGHWKGVRPKEGAPLEVYDLARDIGETTDMAAQRPDIVKKLETMCEAAHQTPRVQKDSNNKRWAKRPV
ncbi:MAG: arylsulfatase [Acidobacteria bacterium]|nr:arylsulfatase [Acidobacteriota bacterium]